MTAWARRAEPTATRMGARPAVSSTFLDSVQTMSMPDRLGGRYQLRDLLGQGGMGEVRDGWDTRLGRPVAIKVLRPELANQPDLRRRFEAEATAAATLNHPHVVAVYDSGEDAGVPYIVMERLPGRTLGDEIAGGRLPEDRVRKILIEVLEALAVAHDAGILHRDIKPGNVLFTDGDSVKVTDFGIAKTTDTDQTMTGQILGTAAYLSPERLAGKPSSVADDLYAVGVVGYEALCGHKPFAEENPFALVRAICDGQALPLAAARPGLDPALVAAIEGAMAREPERRFSSASSMLGVLQPQDSAAVTEPLNSSTPAFIAPTQVLTSTHSPSDTQVLTSSMPLFVPRRRGALERFRGRLMGRSRGTRVAVLIAGFVVFLIVILSLVVNSGGHGSSPSPATSTPPSTAAPAGTGSIPPALARALNNLSKAVQP